MRRIRNPHNSLVGFYINPYLGVQGAVISGVTSPFIWVIAYNYNYFAHNPTYHFP